MISNKAEFSTLCGISSRELAVYIKRNKVFLTDDKIDDSNPVNQMFLQKMQSKKPRAKVLKKSTHKKETVDSVDPDAEVLNSVKKNELTEQLKEKGSLDIQNKKNAITLQEMEIKKKNGELVPTEAVKSLLIAHSESLKNSYFDACENIIIEMSTRKQFSSVEISELKTKLRGFVNRALQLSIKTTKENIDKVMEEYSEKRGIGQHG